MNESKLDFSEIILECGTKSSKWGLSMCQVENAKEILDACTGLTLSDVLARLKAPLPQPNHQKIPLLFDVIKQDLAKQARALGDIEKESDNGNVGR